MLEFLIDTEHPVSIPCDKISLDGILHIPKDVRGLVLFAHGSGSSRLSSRNQHVASVLQQAKIATLLFDLLTDEEEAADINTGMYRFDIPFLSDRLSAATNWVLHNPVLRKYPIGYFGREYWWWCCINVGSKISRTREGCCVTRLDARIWRKILSLMWKRRLY